MDIKLKVLLATLVVIGLLLVPCPQYADASGWLPGWGKRIQFTIDHNDIDAPLTWFPVRLHLSAASNEDTEEQTEVGGGGYPLYSLIPRVGHKLTISNRTVTKLSFKLEKGGAPSGDVTFAIRKTSNDAVIVSKVWGNANALALTPAWKEATFDTPTNVNEEVYLSCEFSGGDGANRVFVSYENSDVKGSENLAYYYNGNWVNVSIYDCAYKYTYVPDVTCVFDELGANSKKIAFTKDDGTTELYGEIEKWDNGNEEAEIWVSRDGWAIASASDTVGYLYYDSTHADNDAYIGVKNSTPAQSVWDANFVGVWHMDDGADTSGVYDSTSNNNDGTKKGAAEPALTTSGYIANAQEFDGADDYVGILDADGISTDTDRTMTFSAWFNLAKSAAPSQCIFDKMDEYALFYDRNNNLKMNFASYGANTDFGGALALSTWHHVVVIWNQTANTLDAWTNGTQVLTSSAYADPSTDSFNPLEFGGQFTHGSGHWADGIIDEIRISNIGRTAAWVEASYESERDDLITWGSEETRERSWGYIIG